MAVIAPGDTLDDSPDSPWADDVDLPGQFGRGGFRLNPQLVGPASGPAQGTSLATTTPDTGASGGGWRNPFTTPHVDPTTGQPEMLTGPGGLVEKTRGQMNPFGFIGRGNPYWRGAIAAGGVLTPTPAETGEFTPAEPNFVRPDAPRGGGLPAPAAQTYPHMPWPDTGTAPIGSPAPAVSSPRPAAAPVVSPAVARQRPNLGAYGGPPPAVANSPFVMADRPNMSPQNSAQGRQGAPQMGMLDLSRLFGGGQPAAAAAAPAAPYPPPRPQPVYNQPGIRMVPPAIPIGGGAGNVMEAPSRRKSSTSSQGGGQ